MAWKTGGDGDGNGRLCEGGRGGGGVDGVEGERGGVGKSEVSEGWRNLVRERRRSGKVQLEIVEVLLEGRVECAGRRRCDGRSDGINFADPVVPSPVLVVLLQRARPYAAIARASRSGTRCVVGRDPLCEDGVVILEGKRGRVGDLSWSGNAR